MTPKIAVILFPGLNCELEALRACSRSHMKNDLFRWNDDIKKLQQYDGYILPGGFSYEDRGRSGVIASKDPILEIIKQEASKGKPVLGLCNGAQILVESGLIPGLNKENPEMALAWNQRIKKGKIFGIGFYNDWIYIRSDVKEGRSVFNRFSSKLIMRVPVAHGEGRFTTRNRKLLNALIQNKQILFRYCDARGFISEDFPVNPNGAMYNLAGICNPEGNVLALMPHPERTINGQPLFDSIADYLKSNCKIFKPDFKKIKKINPVPEKIEKLKKIPQITITVKLIITDNEEKTLENTLRKEGFQNLKLERQIYFGIYTQKNNQLKNIAKKIIESGEMLNINKEIPTITIAKKTYGYEKKKLVKRSIKSKKFKFYVTEYENAAGKNLCNKIAKYFRDKTILKIERGILWSLNFQNTKTDNDSINFQKVIKTHLFHNPHALKIVSLQ